MIVTVYDHSLERILRVPHDRDNLLDSLAKLHLDVALPHHRYCCDKSTVL